MPECRSVWPPAESTCRRSIVPVLCGLVALGAIRPGATRDVYRCIDAQGNVAFQDSPCPAGTTQSQVWLPDAPSTPPQPAAATLAPQSDANPPLPTPASRPAAPLPPLWVCRNAEDGSTYFSRSGSTPVRYVPLGVLGYPGHSLSHAYGAGGIGVSAPELNRTPISTSSRDAIASQYTPLHDECVRASREQTCTWLRKQYDDVTHKLHNAFKDQQAILQPQADELESQLSGC